MKKNILFSIIIPCYNTENTVLETLHSVYNLNYDNWEAIIVNDGSPDNLEALVLDFIKIDKRFKYFKKENGGLASARNFGIKKAIGQYILPLDSDNKVRKEFLNWANDVISLNIDTDIIYGDAQRFGENNSYWAVGPYNFNKLLISNYIDACAIIKSDVFKKFGLYDEKMPYQGLEDWEMWLRCSSNKCNFHYLPKPTFDYRVTSNSMIRSFDKNMFKKSRKYIYNKYSNLYAKAFSELYNKSLYLEKKVGFVVNNPVFKLLKKIREFFK